MTRWLETDSNTNIDISAATVIGSYTADADRLVVPQLLIDQVAGNGDYVYYAALQVNGSGSWYVIGPKTTHAAASGETAIGAQGGAVAMRSGDVLRVYVDGLAGDTGTPDTVVRFFEVQPVREALATELSRIDATIGSRLAPTTAGRTLDVMATGEASANVTLWKGVDATIAVIGIDSDTLETLSDQLDGVSAQISAIGSGTGAGARTIEVTVNDGTDPLENAKVRLTEGASTFVGDTDISGEVTFNLDDATYVVAITKAGYTFAGITLEVTDDDQVTYSMTQSITPVVSPPGQATGWVYCYNYNGVIEAGVTMEMQQIATPETDSYAFDSAIYSVVSGNNGLVQFSGLWIGATYQARRANGAWHSFTVPNAASFALPAMLGR